VAPPPNIRPLLSWSALTVGPIHSCVISATGRVFCWGSNNYLQLGCGRGATLTYGEVQGLTATAVSISAGQLHTCVVLSTGGVQCWCVPTAARLRVLIVLHSLLQGL
jgi:alpha-tubulin suppressor-like RCC1 family protein